MSMRYTQRKYPFAYLANGEPVRHERARREMRPFFVDKEFTVELVLRRRGPSQYFARSPERQRGASEMGGNKIPFRETTHARCLRRVQRSIEAGSPVRVRPFDGLRVHPLVQLLPSAAPGVRYCVLERSLREFLGIRPDLQVRTVIGDRLLLVIEVCDSNPVGLSKAALYQVSAVPCIEIRAVHGVDSDGILNAETMWGPGAPRIASQALLDAKPPSCRATQLSLCRHAPAPARWASRRSSADVVLEFDRSAEERHPSRKPSYEVCRSRLPNVRCRCTA